MLARTECTDEPSWSRTARASLRPRREISEFNRCEIGRDGYPARGRDHVGIGAVIVASIWLAFYVTAAINALVSGI